MRFCMKKTVIILFLTLLCSTTAFSMSWISNIWQYNNPSTPPFQGYNPPHAGGGGVPEPATILLILGGAGAAFAVKKKFLDKK